MMCEISRSDEIKTTDEEAVRRSQVTNTMTVAKVEYDHETGTLKGWDSLYALIEEPPTDT